MKIKPIISATALLISTLASSFAEDSAVFTTAPVEVIEVDKLSNEMVFELYKTQTPVLLKGAAKASPLYQMSWDEIKEEYGHLEAGVFEPNLQSIKNICPHIDTSVYESSGPKMANTVKLGDSELLSKSEFTDANKRNELLCRIVEGTLTPVPSGPYAFHGLKFSLAYVIDSVQEFSECNTAVGINFPYKGESQYDPAKDLTSLPESLCPPLDTGYISHTLDNFSTVFKTKGDIVQFHNHQDAFLSEFKGKKLVLLTPPTSEITPSIPNSYYSMQTIYDEKHSAPDDSVKIKLCSRSSTDFKQVAQRFPLDQCTYLSCCLPHKELNEQIFNTYGETKDIDNTLVETSSIFECPPVQIFYAILEAGDILYIPYLWYHHIEYLENSLGIARFGKPNPNWADETQN